MTFREVSVFEVREVLRLFIRGRTAVVAVGLLAIGRVSNRLWRSVNFRAE